MQLLTAGLLLIKDRKLLLAYSNNKQCFYLPGGKIDKGETALTALIREIQEELNLTLQPEELQYYTHISAPAFGENENVIMEQDCFLTTTKLEPKAAAEIGELRYFTLHTYLQQAKQAPGATMILQQLLQNGLIDP